LHTNFAATATKHKDQDTKVLFSDGMYPPGLGHWAIRFYDVFGEDWLTRPIPEGASCDEVVMALESLPNNAIPMDSVYCTLISTKEDTGQSTGAGDFLNDDSVWSSTVDAQTHGKHSQKINITAAFWDIQGNTFANEIKTLQSAKDTTLKLPGAPSSYQSQSYIPFQGYIYKIKFYGNPGKLRQPEIELYLDGKRPALMVTAKAGPNDGNESVVTRVWTDGEQGESEDLVADHCDGISVTVLTGGSHPVSINTTYQTGQVTGAAAINATDLNKYSYLGNLKDEDVDKLKACLGGSDVDDFNNIEVFDWDTGSAAYPHLVKLVRTVSTSTDGGYYVALYYVPPAKDDQGDHIDGTGIFKLLNPFAPLDSQATDLFDVYTTKGVLARTTGSWRDPNHDNSAISMSEAIFGFASNEIYTTNELSAATNVTAKNVYTGSVSCEYKNQHNIPDLTVPHCLNQSDYFMLFQFDMPALNPPHLNMYTAQKLYTQTYQWKFTDIGGDDNGLTDNTDHTSVGVHIIKTDISTNWASAPQGMYTHDATSFDATLHPKFDVYKFIPAPSSTYTYVAECSNRGICEHTTGLCTCYPGYTSDSCSVLSSLAV